jgi:hypothetical protein
LMSSSLAPISCSYPVVSVSETNNNKFINGIFDRQLDEK